MKHKNIKNVLSAGLLLLLCALVSCNDWTNMESIDRTVHRPQNQDPELWAAYTASLRRYKESEHFIVYARLQNSPEVASSEKDFMRGLPDSLDIVSLTNAGNLSQYDIEDIPVLHDKGTKILYQVDYVSRAAEWTDAATFGTYLDQVVATVAAQHLDGFSFTYIPQADNAATDAMAKLLVQKLGADAEKLLVFEGNPLFIDAEDRAKIDYFVLDTERTTNITDLKLQIRSATGLPGVPADKLLIAAATGSMITGEEWTEHAAITGMANYVVSLGPLAGLGTYGIANDYYGMGMNYMLVRSAIQTLNPSK